MTVLFNVKNSETRDVIVSHQNTADSAVHSPPGSPTGHAHHEHSEAENELSTPLYNAKWFSYPKALFLWNDKTPHMHGDSSSLFFDLIYVGVTFNIGNLLVNSLSTGSILTYLVFFMVMFDSWMKRLYMDSALLTADKIHRFAKLLQGMITAYAAFNLTAETVLLEQNSQLLSLVLSKCCHTILIAVVWAELWKFGKTQAEKGMGKRVLCSTLSGLAFQLAALVVVAVGGGAVEYKSNSGFDNSDAAAHRRLAGEPVAISYSPTAITVLALLTAGYIVERLVSNYQVFFTVVNESNTIPIHVGYILHRFGEFNILMLGEGVLQIILQTMDLSAKYHMLFVGSYLLMALLQLIHYSSMPFAVRDHAIAKSRKRGGLWVELLVVYSAAQVAAGVALKVILKYFRKQLISNRSTDETSTDEVPHRLLAGSATSASEYDPRPYMWLLSICLGVLLILLVVQHGLHRGFKVLFGLQDDDAHGTRKKESPLRKRKKQVGVTLKIGVAIAVSCTPLYVDNLKYDSVATIWISVLFLSLTFALQIMQGAFDRERKFRKTLGVLMFVTKLKSGVLRTRKLANEKKQQEEVLAQGKQQQVQWQLGESKPNQEEDIGNEQKQVLINSPKTPQQDLDVLDYDHVQISNSDGNEQVARGISKSVSRFRSPSIDVMPHKLCSDVHKDIMRYMKKVKLYERPRYLFELQSTADREVAWADLFFDLIYVAVLFKLGELLVVRLYGPMVLFVYVMIFFSLYECWEEKNDFDSRFANKDVFHKFWDVLQGLCIALAASYIVSESEYVGHTSTGDFTFDNRGLSLTLAYTLALLAYRGMRLLVLVELLLTTKLPSVKTFAKQRLSLLLLKSIPLLADLFYVMLTDEPGILVSVGLWGLTLIIEKLASLLLAIYARCSGFEGLGYHQGYLLHRYGEWMMLVLGEGVMQIIITDPVATTRAVGTFATCYLVLTMVRLIHYQIEADNPDSHAFRDSLRGWYWSVSMTMESLSIIALGVFLARLLDDAIQVHEDPEAWGESIEALYTILSSIIIVTSLAFSASDMTHYGHRSDWKSPVAVTYLVAPMAVSVIPLGFVTLRWPQPAFGLVLIATLALCLVAQAHNQLHRERQLEHGEHSQFSHQKQDDDVPDIERQFDTSVILDGGLVEDDFENVESQPVLSTSSRAGPTTTPFASPTSAEGLDNEDGASEATVTSFDNESRVSLTFNSVDEPVQDGLTLS